MVHIKEDAALSISPPGSAIPLYGIREFCIDKGELVGLFGESGCGKTLFARYLLDRGKEEGIRVHYIPQDYSDTFSPYLPMGKQLQLLSDTSGYAGSLKAAAEECGLNRELLYSRREALSGGQLQRFALARAIVSGASLVLADELTTAQDAIRKGELARLIKTIRNQQGTSFLIISHDHRFLSRIAERRYKICGGEMTLENEIHR